MQNNLEQRVSKMEKEIGARRRSVKGMNARDLCECLAGLTSQELENELSHLSDEELEQGIAEIRGVMQGAPDAARTGGMQCDQ